MNIEKININSLVVEDVYMRDYPEFCDAYISYAETVDGRELTEEELEALTIERHDLVLEAAHQSIWP